MPNTPWVPIIKNIVDGTDKVSSEVMNPILKSYTDRTQHLYEKFADLEDKSVIIAFDQPVVGAGVVQYSVVYYDYELTIPGMVLTKPGFALSTYASQFKAAKSAFVFGIVKSDPSSNNHIADIYLQGLVQATGIVTALLENIPDNVGFVGGPLYLSAKASGKLTSVPGGQAIYVGYAKNLNEIYLNPSYESFNDFFFNFKYTILDRPAGTPSLSGTTWSVSNYDINRVGWIPAGISSLTTPLDQRPDTTAYGTPTYFYNLPADTFIDADTGLSTHEKSDAKALRRSLPPNPSTFSFLTVNGIVQDQKEDSTTEGIYRINEYGIWWYSDQDQLQPWAADLYYSIAIPSTAVSGQTITLAGHSYVNGDTIKFFVKSGSGASLPAGITAGIAYTIANVATNTFQLSGTTLTTSGAGTFYIEWTPSAWVVQKGTNYLRPRMVVQYTKVNPDYKTSIVTSLKPSNTSSNNATKSIKLVNATGDVQATGDLFLQFSLNKVATVESVNTASAVKDFAYNPATGNLEVTTGPVISSISALGLARAETNATGQCTITVANANLSNLVTSLEVEQARLEYTGLHSFLTTDYTLLPAGFVGKFLLPPALPDANLQFKIILFGKVNAPSSTKTRLKFQFSYAITNPGVLITSAVTELKIFTIDLGASYLQNIPVLFTPPEFSIPRSALIEGGVVNFRLTRVKPSGPDVTSNYYDSSACIVGTYWNLG